MKGLRKKFRRGLAAFLAFVLTMTSVNTVSLADVSNALETEKATFVMSGEDIVESAQAAIDNGSTFTYEDLGIEETGSTAKEYQKLFTMARYMKSPLLMTWTKRKTQTERISGCLSE